MPDFKESIGALWLKTSQKGMKFFSGTITVDGVETEIVVFKNDKGDNPKRPDYRIFPSAPQESKQKADEFEDDVPF